MVGNKRPPEFSPDQALTLEDLVMTRLGASRPAGAPLTDAKVAQERVDFSKLPGMQDIKLQKTVAAAMGIENPFFRVHEARASAMSSIQGKFVTNFSSYDYLGLNGHPAVCAAAHAAINTYGTSVSASRVVAGERPFHRQLEKDLASHYRQEDCLTFVSGHATNVSAISTLMGSKDLIIHDSYAHNSIVMGASLSGAERQAFPHNDIGALDRLLTRLRDQYHRVLIVVEGLYSMDGDSPDLQGLVELKKRHGVWLMVDDAHGLGVLGPTGRGLFEACEVDPADIDIWMGTFSKTLAGCGGYIAANALVVEYLKFMAGSFVYSVGMSPPLAAASLSALAILHREPERVRRMQRNGALFLSLARQAGLDTGESLGLAVVPVLLGSSLRAVLASQKMLEKGINVQPIIYPAVQENSARLRFFITSEHTEAQITHALEALAQVLDDIGQSSIPGLNVS